MKKLYFFIILNSFLCPLFGQIDVREKPLETLKETIEEKLLQTEYDSTKNAPGIAIAGFIGQRILMNKNNAKGFYSNINADSLKLYQEQKASQYSSPETPIEAVKGKYFKVTGYEITKAKYGSNFNLYFQLLTENDEAIYFLYLDNESKYMLKPKYNFPFVTEGFYKKMKYQCLNKPVAYGYNIYKCTDIFVEEDSNELKFKLKKEGKEELVSSSSSLYRVRPIETLDFTSDSKYLSPEFSSAKGVTSKKKAGSIDISTIGNEILIEFRLTKGLCFSTDDIITLEFTNGEKENEYFRGKFNCNGHLYLKLSVSIERHKKLINYLAKNKLETVYGVGNVSDYLIIDNVNDNLRNSIKANYNKIIGK